MTPGFATAKGAQRMLTQSLARDLGPKGVHCFYVIVDGSIGNDSGVTGTDESREECDQTQGSDGQIGWIDSYNRLLRENLTD